MIHVGLRWRWARAERGSPAGGCTRPDVDAVPVHLFDVPLLLHEAWRQHADSLLREYLLASLDLGMMDEAAIAVHSAASDAIALLAERIPVCACSVECRIKVTHWDWSHSQGGLYGWLLLTLLRDTADRAAGQALYSVKIGGGWKPQVHKGRVAMSVVFQEYDGTLVGIGENGRRWRVVQTVTGWRLEFRDAGDPTATYAGTHRTVESAMNEAAR